ncbi:MAG: hypothetical protein IPN71_17775 [Fibrobacteres bacterium]|nr:hypothetical protein [Fibrobacterota bacterium]
MNAPGNSPLPYHRTRRDHQLRLFFSAVQRPGPGMPGWLRNNHAQRPEILRLLAEALHHAGEVLRHRKLEWPDSAPDDVDRRIFEFLQESQSWFGLLECLLNEGDDPRSALQPLIEARLRLGLAIFHSSRHMPSQMQAG